MIQHTAILQTQRLPTLAQSDSTSVIIAVLVFVLFVLFLVIAGRGGGSTSAGRGTQGGPAKFSRRKFRRHASSRGLTRGETRVLESLIKRYKIQAPYGLLNNSSVLDSSLKKALTELDDKPMNVDEREAQKLTLYRIKQKIERSTKGASTPNSSKNLRVGQTVMLMVEGQRYQSKVSGNLQKSFGVEVPRDKRGNEIRWKKWTKVELYFWRSNGQSFSFHTKLLGYNTLRGVSSLFLQHSAHIKEARQRRYRRKQMEKPSYFYPVRIVSSGLGKKSAKKAIVDKHHGHLSTILDLSAGGCAMRCSYPLDPGALLKIEFETGDRQKVSSFGKVISTNRIQGRGGVMHIMFTRVSRDNMNRINKYVYDFDTVKEQRYPRL